MLVQMKDSNIVTQYSKKVRLLEDNTLIVGREMFRHWRLPHHSLWAALRSPTNTYHVCRGVGTSTSALNVLGAAFCANCGRRAL